MSTPTVSVVVPIYNMEAYLRQCLDSLYAQVDETIEVILVNDGSTDSSPQVCAEYVQKHPDTIYIDKENGGLSDARNAGTEAATGKYIYFLDSDDWLAPDAIRTLRDFAEANRCEVVQGGFYYAFDDHLELDNRWLKEDAPPFVLEKRDAMKQLVKQQYVKNFAWGKLYLTDIVKKHLFKPGMFFEDVYWQHLIIHETKRYGVIPVPLYYYRQRKNSISGAFSRKNIDLLKGNEERLSFICKEYPQLVSDMAIAYWHLCHNFNVIASHGDNQALKDLYRDYYEQSIRKYHSLFNQSMKWHLPYQLSSHCPPLLYTYNIANRVWTHFFSKRLLKLSL